MLGPPMLVRLINDPGVRSQTVGAVSPDISLTRHTTSI
jgi:hypothetical protein